MEYLNEQNNNIAIDEGNRDDDVNNLDTDQNDLNIIIRNQRELDNVVIIPRTPINNHSYLKTSKEKEAFIVNESEIFYLCKTSPPNNEQDTYTMYRKCIKCEGSLKSSRVNANIQEDNNIIRIKGSMELYMLCYYNMSM